MQLGSSWTMGSDSPSVKTPALALEPGYAFVAEVRIHTAADVRRVVCHDGEARVLRDLSGRLFWLESDTRHARRQHGPNQSISEGTSTDNLVIPRDIGSEAMVVIDLQSLCEWTGGQLTSQPRGERIQVDTSDWGPVVVALSPHGSIRAVETDTAPRQRILTTVREHVVPRRAEWFQPVDLELETTPWPW